MRDETTPGAKRLKKLELTRDLLANAVNNVNRLKGLGAKQDTIDEAELTAELYSELLMKLEHPENAETERAARA